MVSEHGGPLILRGDFDEVATVAEEVVGQHCRLATRETMQGDHREVGIQRDQECVEGRVDIDGVWGGPELGWRNTVIQRGVDEVPLRFEDAARVQLVEIATRECVVEDRRHCVILDVGKEVQQVADSLARRIRCRHRRHVGWRGEVEDRECGESKAQTKADGSYRCKRSPRKKNNKGCLKGHVFIDREGDAPTMTREPRDKEDVPGSCYSLPGQKAPCSSLHRDKVQRDSGEFTSQSQPVPSPP